MRVLGIETSCDDTSSSIVEDGRKILSDVIASQIDLHARFGGIVPEIASRKHVELINIVIREALDKADLVLRDVDAIAVTNRPGLLGALLVGVSAAKAISAALNLPLVGVHHLEGHIYANFLANPDLQFPFVCLIVSGGHTDLVLVSGHGEYRILGRTRDDASGEAFDKSARAMGLGYPGGPIIDSLAKDGNPEAVRFPRSKVDGLDFSFSGIKTAVVRHFQAHGGEVPIEDLAASFQASVVEMLVSTTMRAVEQTGIKRVALGGGVAANSGLKRSMQEVCDSRGIELSYPPPRLCTDNAAMIACAGYHHVLRGDIDGLDLDTVASQPLS